MDAGTSIPECDLYSARWLAPEQLLPEKFGMESVRCTKETDIYAFAMVMYEVSILFILILRWDLALAPSQLRTRNLHSTIGLLWIVSVP